MLKEPSKGGDRPVRSLQAAHGGLGHDPHSPNGMTSLAFPKWYGSLVVVVVVDG